MKHLQGLHLMQSRLNYQDDRNSKSVNPSLKTSDLETNILFQSGRGAGPGPCPTHWLFDKSKTKSFKKRKVQYIWYNIVERHTCTKSP